MNTLKFKYNGRCKKIVLGRERLTWENITQLLSKAFGLKETEKVQLTYMDSQNSEKKVQTERELQAAYQNLFLEKFIRFFVHYSGTLELQQSQMSSNSFINSSNSHSYLQQSQENAQYQDVSVKEFSEMCQKAKEKTMQFEQIQQEIANFTKPEEGEGSAHKIEYQIEGNLLPLAEAFAKNMHDQLTEQEKLLDQTKKPPSDELNNKQLANTKIKTEFFAESEKLLSETLKQLDDPMYFSRIISSSCPNGNSRLPPVKTQNRTLCDDLDELSSFMRQLRPTSELIDLGALQRVTVLKQAWPTNEQQQPGQPLPQYTERLVQKTVPFMHSCDEDKQQTDGSDDLFKGNLVLTKKISSREK